MSEMAKSGLFVGAALASLLAAFVVGPSADTFDAQELVGERLNQFDIDAPKRLKIIKFDADSASAREFEVAEEGGLWTIPSKQGYPADAARQMAEAATSLMDREILRVAATTANEHEELGVINPSSSNLDAKAAGVGTRVTMSDLNNNILTDMIIGKPVRDAAGQFYVRNANQDIVYVLQIDPTKLTTRFEDWIEDDLLKLSPFDIRRVNIKDYSAEMMLTLQGFQVDWDRRAEMELRYDNEEAKWFPESIRKFDPASNQYVAYELADDEQLNEDVLQDLRNALDDLNIVDVERKPAGLSADLKAGESFVKDNTAASSLMLRGFAPVAIGEEKDANILSSEGEVIVTLRNGVEYVLRFGNLQMEGDEAPGDADVASLAGDGINRYLFVMAQFNESMIERPELDDLPEIPSREDSPAPADTDDNQESATEDAGVEANANEEATADPAEGNNDQNEEVAQEEGADEVAAEEVVTEDDATGEEEAQPDQQQANDSEGDEEASETEAAEATEEEDEIADIIAARKEIERENQRRLDEYQDRVDEGKQRVAELNERFGDWYYVISNDVYQKVSLSLDKVITKVDEEAADEEATDEEVPQFEAPATETIELDSLDIEALEAEGLDLEAFEAETDED